MTEEELKAIELLEEFKKTGYHTLMIKYNNDRIKTNTKVETAIQTVLNLVKKQQEEIDRLIEDLITTRVANKVIGENVIGYQENQIKLQEELEKKDKIIDLMVKRIKEDTEWFYSDLDYKSEEEIKQYFENKVEGSK